METQVAPSAARAELLLIIMSLISNLVIKIY